MNRLLLAVSLLATLLCGLASPMVAAAPAQSADQLLGELGLTPAKPQFLPLDQAFVLTTRQEGNRLLIALDIADGYYLYRDKLSWQVSEGKLGQVQLPSGERHNDAFFGQTEVFYQSVDFAIPLLEIPAKSVLTLSYQGCTEGLCYPPASKQITLQPITTATNQAATPATDQPQRSGEVTPAVNQAPVDASDRLQGALAGSWLTAAGLFLLLGLGLALTPCMLPMYPILSAIILGRGALPLRRAFLLSLAYVQGMALTYTLLGLAVASMGASLQAWLQQPLVLVIFSLLFIALAAAMFGAFSLQLPPRWQHALHQLAGAQSSGSLPGVFVMGAISALVCSPCTTAPLSGALLYVSQSGDRALGAVVLYALALGMGIPLLLLGTLGPRWLPRRGLWMQRVKVLFGFILLAVPVLLLARILPEPLIRAAWSVLIMLTLGYLLLALCPISRLRRLALLLLPLLAIASWFWLAPSAHQTLPFVEVKNLQELEQQLAMAREQGQPVMLDLYADWCVACKQFEEQTFSDPQVQQRLLRYHLLRVDVTDPLPPQRELLETL
nr:protein-disulfide reductase DsbD [Aeromonas sp.]